MKRRALVYPYTDEFTPILRYGRDFAEYNFLHLVSPVGFGLVGKDASEADQSAPLSQKVEGDFETILRGVDTVILADPGSYFVMKEKGPWRTNHATIKLMLAKAKLALAEKKEVICLLELDDVTRNELQAEAIDSGAMLRFCGDLSDQTLIQRVLAQVDETPKKIPVPVIAVMGMGSNTDKFQIQLGLRKSLVDLGLKVGWIGSREYCELVGGYSFPAFMNENKYTVVQKIELFNHFVYEVAQAEGNDAVIIGIPGGVIPVNRQLHNHYGSTAYLATQAVIPDYTVFTYYCNSCDQELAHGMAATLKYRCNSGLDAAHLSRFIVKMDRLRELGHTEYFRYPDKTQENFLKEHQQIFPNTYNGCQETGMKALVDNLVANLSGETHADVLNERGTIANV